MTVVLAAQDFRAGEETLTAETAETTEKKILRILGELCVLCGKTSHFFHTLFSPAQGIQ